MLKVDKKWCSECCDCTKHKYVGSRGEYEGFGVARLILAITSFGISETMCRYRYWQCEKCGNTIKE